MTLISPNLLEDPEAVLSPQVELDLLREQLKTAGDLGRGEINHRIYELTQMLRNRVNS